MKKIILLMAGTLIFASCSTPKYAYHFDQYDYNSGKKQSVAQSTPIADETTPVSPLIIKDEPVVASSVSTPSTASANTALNAAKKDLAEKFASMSKEEKKEFKKDLKADLKKYVKAKKSGDNIQVVQATKAWDHDLKMAAIFGAIAIVLTAFYGISPIFWVLGVVALVIAVVFLIKWLSRQ